MGVGDGEVGGERWGLTPTDFASKLVAGDACHSTTLFVVLNVDIARDIGGPLRNLKKERKERKKKKKDENTHVATFSGTFLLANASQPKPDLQSLLAAGLQLQCFQHVHFIGSESEQSHLGLQTEARYLETRGKVKDKKNKKTDIKWLRKKKKSIVKELKQTQRYLSAPKAPATVSAARCRPASVTSLRWGCIAQGGRNRDHLAVWDYSYSCMR